MVEKPSNSFPKQERICSKKLMDRLFNGRESHAMSAYPIRVIYRFETQEGGDNELPKAQVLMSVPKKCFKRAVKRNRVKRQMREAYRCNRHLLTAQVPDNKSVLMAFVWLDAALHPTKEVAEKVKNLLQRISEKL
jgi:ribonuclease P protein component